MKLEYNREIICSALANECSKSIIDMVLNHFIPNYEKINLDYCCPPDDDNYEFKSEDEMINYFIDNKNFRQTFYWKQYKGNPDNIMVGADILSDDKLVISLTVDGNNETEQKYYLELKKLLKSDIGVISYVNPPEYDSGQDFIERYKDMNYEFEK